LTNTSTFLVAIAPSTPVPALTLDATDLLHLSTSDLVDLSILDLVDLRTLASARPMRLQSVEVTRGSDHLRYIIQVAKTWVSIIQHLILRHQHSHAAQSLPHTLLRQVADLCQVAELFRVADIRKVADLQSCSRMRTTTNKDHQCGPRSARGGLIWQG
jgi:hypothetical protein